ncbi:MAG: 23S rRNA (uracil(1939)-C(5))-methyltransferase RlmD [Elusimicrobia bacterium]|nr:23S rRNA (uracil(1939)-C(5))-methyltransferase RlmD [Elusimicrobiota bacterium]
MERLTVKVERMAPEGSGLARAEGPPSRSDRSGTPAPETPGAGRPPSRSDRSGTPAPETPGAGSSRIVFVPYAVPGDRLEVEVVAQKPTYLRARLRSVLEAGPGRIVPRCPIHFDPGRRGPACGGCGWQQLEYERQLEAKRGIVADALRRIGKLGQPPIEPVRASPQQWNYRNKVQIPFGRNPQSKGPPLAGFFEQGTHRIVPLEDCPVQSELSVRIFRKVRDLAAKFGWSVYSQEDGRGWLRHLYVRTNAAGQALAAVVALTDAFPRREEFVAEMTAAFPEIASLYHNVQPLKTSVVLGPIWKRLAGDRGIEERIGSLRFKSSPGSFLQVNSAASEILYDETLQALTEGGKTFPTVYDIYCGVGTISLWIAGRTQSVIGIEENGEAVRNAIDNARANGIRNVRFLAGRAESVLARAMRGGGEGPGRAAAIVDPPRSGLTPPVLRCLTARRFERLVYVSCDPATFARDAGYLLHSGFRLRRVQPVDLFPQTSHVELVALLDRT